MHYTEWWERRNAFKTCELLDSTRTLTHKSVEVLGSQEVSDRTLHPLSEHVGALRYRTRLRNDALYDCVDREYRRVVAESPSRIPLSRWLRSRCVDLSDEVWNDVTNLRALS